MTCSRHKLCEAIEEAGAPLKQGIGAGERGVDVQKRTPHPGIGDDTVLKKRLASVSAIHIGSGFFEYSGV
jgi:hypothetical protein